MERNPLAVALEKAWKGGITVQSQFFRDNPKLVALAASMGYITTLDPLGNYGGVWRITPTGCYQLFNNSDKDLYDIQLKGLEVSRVDSETPNTTWHTDTDSPDTGD